MIKKINTVSQTAKYALSLILQQPVRNSNLFETAKNLPPTKKRAGIYPGACKTH
jgi:hypothetical protein